MIFVLLRVVGMIDFDFLIDLKILELICMNDDEGGFDWVNVVYKEVREMELVVFLSWIEFVVKEEVLLCFEIDEFMFDELFLCFVEVICYNCIDWVIDFFVDNVWLFCFWCVNCYMEGGYNFECFFDEFGLEMEWMFKDDFWVIVCYLM